VLDDDEPGNIGGTCRLSCGSHGPLMRVPDGAGMVCDPALPSAGLLLGDGAGDLLSSAVHAVDGVIHHWTATHVRYSPGRRLAVRYRVEGRWPRAATTVATYVALHQSGGLPDGAMRFSDGDAEIAVWAYPHDPFLPGLPSAATPSTVEALLAPLGGTGATTLHPRVYRPTSRAVIEAHSSSDASLYLKVVRPHRADGLADAHRRLAGRLPVPAVLGVDRSRGIVALEALPGRPFGEVLLEDGPAPDGTALAGLLDAIAHVDTGAAQIVERPAEAAARHAATIAATEPRAAADAAAVAMALADQPYTPDRTVHGDFYEAQLLVGAGELRGLLDVDGLRPGDAYDDASTLIAHLDVLRWAHPHAAWRVEQLRTSFLDALPELDPATLGPRTAGVLLGLALWPLRSQRPRWREEIRSLTALAARQLWRGAATGVAHGGGADEEPLIGTSRPCHGP
jgi:hypothetical protein